MSAVLDTPRSLRAPPALVLLVGAVTALGLALRLIGIGDRSLWLDESFSFWMATQPFDTLWLRTMQIDVHPPLYYALLHFWIGPDSSAADLRAFSALWGAAAIPVVHLIGREVGGRAVGVLAALLMAISPLNVAYGQQGRMYTMLTFFAVVAMYCAVRLVATVGHPAQRHPLSPATGALCWAGFAVSTALAMLTQNTAVLLAATVGAFAVALAVLRRTSALKDTARNGDEDAGRCWVTPRCWVAGGAAVLLLWLPWFPGFLAQSARIDAEFWISPPTPLQVLEHVRDLAAAYSPDAVAIPIVIATVALATLGAWRLRHRPELLLLLLLLLLGPLVAQLLVSLRRPIFSTRTLIWTAVPLFVLLATGITQLRRRGLIPCACAALLVVNLVGLVSWYREPGAEDWRGAAAYIAARAQPGDVVLFSAGWTELPFSFYYRRTGGPPVEAHGLPVDPFERDELEPRMAESDIPRLDLLVAGRPRIWLVLSHDWYTDPQRIVTDHLGQSWHVTEQQDLAGMRIQAYQP